MFAAIDLASPDRHRAAKVVIRGVSKRFGSGHLEVAALSDVSLCIEPNDFLCIVGPSGCGKSTLLNILAGFDVPTSGQVLVDGTPIVGPSIERGVVFQQGALFVWMSVLDNIAFGPRCRGISRQASREMAFSLVKKVGLTGFEQRYPYELSGGMQQRVGIARALANDPAMLLMDEPFASLDQQTRDLLQEEVKRIWRATAKTMVWITHSIDEALFLATHIVVMSARPGKVKATFSANFGEEDDLRVSTSPEFAAAKRVILELLREESLLASHQEGLRIA
jgi:ABC-type nitrate/sulfonate/bicarbonate transport system ATPase subunit